jgi:dipeptidyl aminopeptidase/acylaminoacyl peptidase
VLASHVSAYAASASGQRVALLRTHDITANGVALFDLAVLDFESMQVRTLLEKTPRLAHLTISPDDGWIAYISLEEGNQIYALNIQSPEQRRVLGACHQGETTLCSEIHWSPDGKMLLWSDARGIWISSSDHNLPSLAHPNRVQVVDPGGKQIEIEVRFQNLRWSPDGRYVLVETLPQGSEVRWQAIVDTRRERLVRVPESFESQQLSSPVIWMQDGSLLAILNNPASSSEQPHLRHWQVVDTHDELLILNQGFALSSTDLPLAPEGGAQRAYCANWLTRSAENQLLLVFSVPGSRLAPVVFSLDLAEGKLHKLFELPPDIDQLLWTPDGGGALILGEQSRLMFVSGYNEVQLDLRPILGEDAHDFNWLPPGPPI